MPLAPNRRKLINSLLTRPTQGPIGVAQRPPVARPAGSPGLTNAGSVGGAMQGPVTPQQRVTNQAGVGQQSNGPIGNTQFPPQQGSPGKPPLPVDPLYNQQIAEIDRGLGTTQADLLYQGQRAAEDYGIDNTSNPYSRAALLQKHYNEAQAASRNSMAAQGQLYSGALSNAFGANQNAYNQGSDALTREYNDKIYNLLLSGTKAKETATEGRISAKNDAIIRALMNRPDAPPTKTRFKGDHGGSKKKQGQQNRRSIKDFTKGPIPVQQKPKKKHRHKKNVIGPG